MTQDTICRSCGEPLTVDARQGFCPRCLLVQAAMGGSAAELADDPTCDEETSASIEPQESGNLSAGLPHLFGDYVLLEEIARGGMGIVYRARQVSLDRIVAVKMLLLGPLSSSEYVKRFRAEASVAASLMHPNIVAIHEVGVHQGQQFFAMDYVEGWSLASVLAQGSIPSRKAAHYLRIIAGAIHYAHERGILHRDLKPSNVILDTSDQPRITDFGLARRMDGSSELTVTGQVMGSPSYMPPEQVAGIRGKLSRRSDVYSLGAMLYHLITGRPPFVGETLPATLEQVLNSEPVSPHLLNQSVARDLETICLKCLEKEPDKRYGTALELVEELGRFLNDEPIRARPVTRAERVWRWCRRKPALAGFMAATALLLLAILIGSPIGLYRINRERQRANESADESLRRLVQSDVDIGNLLTGEGQSLEALPWFAEALRLEKDVGKQAMHRLRLESTLQRCPRLEQLWTHAGLVSAIEFSASGRRVASGSHDHTARVWDVLSGEAITPPLPHAGPVLMVNLSPDGARLLTLAEGGRSNKPVAGLSNSVSRVARIWDADLGKLLFELDSPAPIRAAEFSRDGHLVVTTDRDHTVRIWRAEDGRLERELKHDRALARARLSPNASHLVACAEDGSVLFGDLTEFRIIQQAAHIGGGDLAFSPDGRKVATFGEASTVVIWDVISGRRQSVLQCSTRFGSGGVNRAEFDPAGSRILTAVRNEEVQIWDAATGARLIRFREVMHESWSTDEFLAGFSQDGRHLAVSSYRGVRLYDAKTGQAISPRLSSSTTVIQACFAPDREHLLAAGSDGAIRLWNFAAPERQHLDLPWIGGVDSCDFSRDGRLVLATADNVTGVWDSVTGLPVATNLTHYGDPQRRGFAEFSRDSRQVVTSGANGQVRVWDSRTGKPLTPVILHSTNSSVFARFNPEGTRIVTFGGTALGAFIFGDGRIRWWDAATGEAVARPAAASHRAAIVSAEFSPDARWLVTASADLSAQVWDAGTGVAVGQPLHHPAQVWAARFSPDSDSIATGGGDGVARVWEVRTGKPVGSPMLHQNEISSLAFSPDGLRLAVSCWNQSVTIWSIRSGERAFSLVHAGGVYNVEYSPDGRFLATSSDKGTRFWDALTGDAITPYLPNSPTSAQAWILHFSPDGRRVAAASQFANNVCLWALPDGTQRASDLMALSELISGQTRGSGNRIEPLSPDALLDRWAELRRPTRH